MVRECNSEYAYELIKGCRYMRLLRDGTPRCECKNDCAECTVGGSHPATMKQKTTTKKGRPKSKKESVRLAPRVIESNRVPIPMHPELYMARQEEKRMLLKSSNARGLMDALKNKKAEEEELDGVDKSPT